MQKDDLKSIVTQIYENLIEQINQEDDATKEQLVSYLKDSAEVVNNMDDNQIDSMEHVKSIFTNAYKEIANKSLSSYESTNGRFKELTQMHEETIVKCDDQQINLPLIKDRFNEIQTHMTDEINKANEIITQLSKQVKTLEGTSNLDSLTKVFNSESF